MRIPFTQPGRRHRAVAGRQSRLVWLVSATLLAGSLPPVAQAQISLPALGDSASEDLGIGTERKLGDEIMRQIHRDPDYLDDPILLEYLQSLWQPLVAAARAQGDLDDELRERFAYEPFLVRERSVNAFALPGGFIGVFLGLMAITQTRDELASVLAHEMTHVNQRHIARGIANSKKQSLITAAAMILGVLAATRSGGAEAANAAIIGGQAMSMQSQLNYSRDFEREADRIGMAMMSRAGFEPSGMSAMFERLQQASRLNDYGNFPYLRSHPLTTERIGEARSRLGTLGLASPGARTSSPATALEHTAALARARVLMDTRADALQRWQELDGNGSSVNASRSERFADAYSSALASSLMRDWARADVSTRKALDLARGSAGPAGAAVPPDARAERALRLMQVQSLIDRGDLAQARSLLASVAQSGGPQVPGLTPTSRPVLLLGAQIALGQSATDPAAARLCVDQLQTWVAQYPLDAEAWLSLSRLLTPLGQGLRSLRAAAESRYALGDFPGAIDRLRAGRRLAGSTPSAADFVELSVMDSRLNTIEALRKQQLLDSQKF